MINSQLLDHACALRDQGKFGEAYDEFLRAANHTDSILEKAGILLNAVTTLTQSGKYELARKHLDTVRGLLSDRKMGSLGPSEQNEFIGITVSVEVEEAEILTSEGRFEEAIKKFTDTLKQYEQQLKERGLFEISDDVQMRRAFLWADMGSFEKAKPSLEELEYRQSENPLFLFYLGHCYVVTKDSSRARQKLEKAISIGMKPQLAFQAHCSLGMALYELGEYSKAKEEFERGIQTAPPRYIAEAKIWKWLQYTCLSLGLNDEAEHYRRLSEPH